MAPPAVSARVDGEEEEVDVDISPTESDESETRCWHTWWVEYFTLNVMHFSNEWKSPFFFLTLKYANEVAFSLKFNWRFLNVFIRDIWGGMWQWIGRWRRWGRQQDSGPFSAFFLADEGKNVSESRRLYDRFSVVPFGVPINVVPWLTHQVCADTENNRWPPLQTFSSFF